MSERKSRYGCAEVIARPSAVQCSATATDVFSKSMEHGLAVNVLVLQEERPLGSMIMRSGENLSAMSF